MRDFCPPMRIRRLVEVNLLEEHPGRTWMRAPHMSLSFLESASQREPGAALAVRDSVVNKRSPCPETAPLLTGERRQ